MDENTNLPYGGDLQKARDNNDTQAIQQIMNYMQQRIQEMANRYTQQENQDDTNNTINHPECYNQESIITQEHWSKDNIPDKQIRFIDNPNIIGINNENVKYQCYSRHLFLEHLDKNPASTVRQWVQEYDYLDPSLQDVAPSLAQMMDHNGYHGTPSIVREFYKFPDRPAYFDNVDVIQNPEIIMINAYRIANNIRVGNLGGNFTESSNHGQLPGYSIYHLLPAEANNLKLLRNLLVDELSNTFDNTPSILEYFYNENHIDIIKQIFTNSIPYLSGSGFLQLQMDANVSYSTPMALSTAIQMNNDILDDVYNAVIQSSFLSDKIIKIYVKKGSTIPEIIHILHNIFHLTPLNDIEEMYERTENVVDYIQNEHAIQYQQ